MRDNFYSSIPWLKVRAKVLKRDNYCCVLCNTSVHGKGMARVDHYPHTRRERPDIALDMHNLRSLCPSCDNLQSHARGQRFGHAAKAQVGEDGFTDAWRG